MDYLTIIAIVVIVIVVLVAAAALKTGRGKKKLSLYERAMLERKREKGF